MSATHLSILGSVCALLFAPLPRCTAEEAPPLTMKCLLGMDRCALEALYCQAPAAPMLDGCYTGLAIRKPGSKLAKTNAAVTGLIWKGKKFCAASGSLINLWGLGVEAVEAQVCPGESWVDGKPALIMDYRGSSPIIWRNVRDELREIAPGLYLGVMVHDRTTGIKVGEFFALEAQ
jgi:hypothetical protein